MDTSWFVFDSEHRSHEAARSMAESAARDGWMRFIFSHDGRWYMSRMEPPHQYINMVEAVIPPGFRYSGSPHYDA